MWLEAIEVGILVGDYVYHRYFQEQPAAQNPAQEFKLPTATVGSTIPIFYGQVLIKTPVLVYVGKPIVYAAGSGPASGTAPDDVTYAMNMFFVAGIPFSVTPAGFATVRLVNVYAGEAQLYNPPFFGNHPGEGQYKDDPGDGDLFEDDRFIERIANGNTGPFDGSGLPLVDNPKVVTMGRVKFLNGKPAQIFMSGASPANEFARSMLTHGIINPEEAYRGYVMVGLMPFVEDDDTVAWVFGTSPQPPAYSFEVLSLPEGLGSGVFNHGATAAGAYDYDVNPADVFLDICTGTMGKLGLDPTRIDQVALAYAASTLKNEGFGISALWTEQKDAKAYLDDLMVHIDGVYYEDNTTGLLVLKLIRPDYNPFFIRTINPSNCQLLDDVAVGGWTDVINKVRVKFTDRSNHYRDGSSSDQNQANAVGQDGAVRSIELQFPFIMHQGLADAVRDRELAARSKPLFKCRAYLDGSFYRLNVGDVLRLDWPDANIAGYVMRVAARSRGTLKDGTILVDLIQDFFYNWRNQPPLLQGGNPFDHIGDIGSFTFGP